MATMTLYFLDTEGKQIEVARGLDGTDAVNVWVDIDLEKRMPEFVSYYKRWWYDDTGRLWIDFGSHTCFYFAKPEEGGGCDSCIIADSDEEKGEEKDE